MEVPPLVVAQRVARTDAEGPGLRYAVWVAGCTIRCPGCCNPEMFDARAGEAIAIETLADDVRRAAVDGLTLLGGEPFEQAAACASLASAVASAGGSVMVFTGYLREDLERRDDPHVRRLLAVTDLLVDGPYMRDRPETSRRWIGSANQRMHFLSSRHFPGDPRLSAPNQLVIRLERGSLAVHGFPARSLFARARRS